MWHFFKRKRAAKEINREDSTPNAGQSSLEYDVGAKIGGRYQVLDVFSGGLGLVYVVKDLSHRDDRGDEVFALKTSKDMLSREGQNEFAEEAKTWIKLSGHPNVLRAYWVEEISGKVFVATELVMRDELGRLGLEDYIASGPLSIHDVVRWSMQFCYGMSHCYQKGLIAHKDVKPQNLLIGRDGTLKIADFGISAFMEINILDSQKIDEIPNLIRVSGTPSYMPPEQWLGHPVDERSDLYSFGIVLFEMCFGRSPWMTNQLGELYHVHLYSSLPKGDHPLWRIIEKCTHKHPNNRFESIHDLEDELAQFALRNSVPIPEKLALDQAGDEKEDLRRKSMLGNVGNFQVAIPAAIELVERWPDDNMGWTQLGRLFMDVGEIEQAEYATRRSLGIDATRSPAWNNLGLILSKQQRDGEAIAAFQEALKFDSKNTGAMLNAAGPLMSLGRTNEAIKLLRDATSLAPDKHSLWMTLGSILVAVGERHEGVRCLEKALGICPPQARDIIKSEISKAKV